MCWYVFHRLGKCIGNAGIDNYYAVTIYVADPNTTICGGYQEEIQLGDCWNSTFAYYSIDMCDLSGLDPQSSTVHATSPATATPTPTSAPSDSGPSTGTLVGGIVGGLAGLALLLGLALWILKRKKSARKHAAFEEGRQAAYAEMEASPYRGEVDGGFHRHEMAEGGAKDVYKLRAAEVEQPIAELAAGEPQPRDGGYAVRHDGS